MINNDLNKDLHETKGDAGALLRLEKSVTTPWAFHQIHRFHKNVSELQVLDVGCGGGSLTLELARAGLNCTGLDVSEEALNVGRTQPGGERINWVKGSAENLPFKSASFDVVCLMDVLEHTEDPRAAMAEATRVLKADGTLLFHTFNRTPMGWLFADKGLDFIKNSANGIRDWKMFIRPEEVRDWLSNFGFSKIQFQGIQPKIMSSAFWKLILTRRVPENFKFKLGSRLSVGYLGAARREE